MLTKNKEKNTLFFFSKKYENCENIFILPKKNAIFLVLPIEEISLQPELSSPARFRIQGGPLSVTDKVWKSLCLGYIIRIKKTCTKLYL